MRNKDNCFPADTIKATNTIVLKHKDEFINLFEKLHRKLANNATTAYFPVLQKFDTVL